MATLVSPGVSVTITDDSFFIPASAPTVPLIFIATADEKLRPDGITNAEGTFESEVVRAVTSLKQSTDLYGIPKFLEDSNGNQFHGDARNEYGVFGLNQFLGVGNLAYVLRTNVNLNDDLDDLRTLWDNKIASADILMQNLTQAFINEFNLLNGYTIATPGTAGFDQVDLGGLAIGTNTAYSAPFIGNTLTATVTVDATPYAVTTGIAVTGLETYNDIANLIQTAIGVNGTVGFSGGNLVVTSATTGITSTVSIADGADVVSGSQTVDFGGGVVGTNTAYSAPYITQTVTAVITIDGVPYAVSSAGAIGGTETYDDMLLLVQTAIGANGTISIVAGDIVVTSASTGIASTVSIVDGGALSEFFAGMDIFAAINAGVPGVAGSFMGGLDNFVAIDPPVAGTASPFKQTVTKTEFLSLADEALTDTFASFSFISSETEFKGDWRLIPRDVFGLGFTLPPTGSFIGLLGEAEDWVTLLLGGTVPGEWDSIEAGSTIVGAADEYKFTNEFFANTSLGANDAARRVAIVTAFQASINGSTELRSENFQYNLIVCPGYHETVDEMLNLVADIQDEALVIGDTPMDKNPDGITNPTTGWAVTSARQNSVNVAYYYPHSLASNLDGKNILAAASGTALRTYAINDDTAFLWFAPAGLRRGLVTGVSGFGYASGTLGSATTFEETNLNQGQRDALYQDAPSGRINPLVFFPGSGFVIWGQKTSAPTPSSMDRVNVSRLIKYVKRSLRKNTLSFVFEPNDQMTRDSLKAVVDSFLGDLIVKRGLFDFATISDESNNTPDRIDRNEMYIDVALKPTKTAEFLFIPIRILTTGAEL